MSPFAILGTSMSNTQLELIGMGNFNCNYTMYDDTLTGNCASVTYINNWQSNYQCTGMSTGPYLATSGQNQGVTNVEYLKAELLVKIAGRLGGHFCSDVNIPSSQPSGVKYFSRGIPGSSSGAGGSAVAFDPIYAAAGASQYVNFETVGTPYDYLSQITNGAPSCYTGSSSAILDQITARMQQIDSSVNSGLVTTALKGNSPATGTPQTLHLKGGSFSTDNGTLYMYVDPATHNVFMTPQLPVGWSDTTTGSPAQYPDGAAPAVNSGECYDQYPLNGWVVNTQNALTGDGGGAGAKGDAHYHDQPFTQPPNASGPPSFDAGGPMASSADNGTTAPIYGQDQAIFKPSSGSANILGELKFQENTQGTTFCKPN
jgi:hypothetical protein